MPSTQRFLLFLFAQARRFPLQEAVELGQLLHKSGHSVRACVKRLVRSGMLEREKCSARPAWYRLTPKGETMAAEVAIKFLKIHDLVESKHTWDGTWTLVSFDIPERIRKRRDELRMRLREIGFGPLTGGVWIAPGDLSQSVKGLADTLKVGRRIMVALSKEVSLGESSASESAARIWPLAKLNKEYKVMHARIKRRIEDMRKKLEAGSRPDSRTAFLEIFILFSEASELITQDPCLPEELLPKGWLGLDVQDLIHEYFHMLHGLEQNDPYAFLLRLPAGLHIPLPRNQ